jgi:disulfide oxidoreductase YuzD
VEVEHLDLGEPENGQRFASLVSMAKEQNLQYPLVMVDGQLRLAGSAQVYHILPLVQEALAQD